MNASTSPVSDIRPSHFNRRSAATAGTFAFLLRQVALLGTVFALWPEFTSGDAHLT